MSGISALASRALLEMVSAASRKRLSTFAHQVHTIARLTLHANFQEDFATILLEKDS